MYRVTRLHKDQILRPIKDFYVRQNLAYTFLRDCAKIAVKILKRFFNKISKIKLIKKKIKIFKDLKIHNSKDFACNYRRVL